MTILSKGILPLVIHENKSHIFELKLIFNSKANVKVITKSLHTIDISIYDI